MAGRTSESVTAGTRVYNIIRSNIVNLNLAPGTAMSEQDLSEKLNVSRTPVREAFIKLSKEGLVNIVPQKGTFIAKIKYSAVNEERFLRESLERAVLEIFITEHSDDAITRMKRIIEKQKIASEEKDYIHFMEYDDRFHQIIFEDANKTKCYEIIMSMCGNYRRIRFLSMLVEDVVEKNIAQHEKLVEMIQQKNEDGAKEVLRDHLRKVLTEKDEIVEQYPEYFEDANVAVDVVEISSENNIFKQLKRNK